MVMAQRKYDYSEPFAYEEAVALKTRKQRKKSAPSPKASQLNRARVKILAMMLVLIAMFGVIGAKTVHTTVVKGAEIKALEKELQALTAENDLLQVEVDKLRSVSRIEKAALAMGMEKPEGTIYIASSLIQPEKAVGVEQTQKTAAVPAEVKSNSVFDHIFRIFTSFFASTQR